MKTLSAAGQDAGLSRVASDADGDAVAVWYGSGPDLAGWRVESRQISAAGALGPVQILEAGGQHIVDEPRIASNPDGNAVAVWSRFDGESRRVRGSLGP